MKGETMFIKIKGIARKVSLLTTIISLLTVTIVLAASGDLDPTFDGDGLVTNHIVPSAPSRGDEANGVIVQPDGKIVAVGYTYIPSSTTQDFAVARYNVDGSLDSTFSSDGLLTTNYKGIETAFNVAVQANGKIVVAGQVCASPTTKGACDAALARYNSNGTLDTSFSTDGKVATDYGGSINDAKGGIAIQPDGKILVGGSMYNGKDNDFAIYRYHANGNLDTTFSNDGKAKIGFGVGRYDSVEDIVLQSNGKILVAGSTCNANKENCDWAILRLNSNGTLDKTFSGDGLLITNLGANDKAWGVALDPVNERIVVVGTKYTSTQSYFAVARYTTTGGLDTTFRSTGKFAFSVLSGSDSSTSDVLVLANHKIVITGSAKNGSLSDFALVRLNGNGDFDTTFNGNGKVTIDFGGDDFGLGIGLQPSDGSYVLAGYTDDGSQRDFALVRILP